MKTEGLHVVRPRTAGLNVHKMEITATVRLCEGGGEPEVETRCFGTLPSGLDEMVAWLTGHGVEAAVMEGTGVYWQAPFEALEAGGIEAILVHARLRRADAGDPSPLQDPGVGQFTCVPRPDLFHGKTSPGRNAWRVAEVELDWFV